MLAMFHLTSALKFKREECEVCIKTIEDFSKKNLNDDCRKSETAIEDAFKKFCSNMKDIKEIRFCYYVGGSVDSATGMLKEISTPLKNYYPVEKICEKLNKKDSQICQLRYDKKIDLKNVNLKKLKVRDLKKILSDWDTECKGCTEKSEYIKMIEELMPTHFREEL